jgi:hypothetical protein
MQYRILHNQKYYNMKKIILLFTAAIFIAFQQVINAQAPNNFDFQSLVRDASGKFLKSQSVGLRISILHGSVSGTAVYTETHTVSTNTNGLLTLTVGKGTTSDNFSSINWSAGPYFIKTEMDLSGGTDYSLSSITQMISVPYALYANSAGDYEARLAALEARADAAEAAMASVPTYHADGFSIEPHRQVQFSKGNLTYNYSTKKYAFATKQYTFSIDYTALNNQAGTTFVFNNFAKNGIRKCDVSIRDTSLIQSQNTADDIAYYAQKDIGEGWFTMSAEQWSFLIYRRHNASKLYSRATVNGVVGLVILPDGWSLPSGQSFMPVQSSWSANIYSAAQWQVLEQAGAIFLPNTTETTVLDNTFQYSKTGAKGYRCSSLLYRYLRNSSTAYDVVPCVFEFVRSYCQLLTGPSGSTGYDAGATKYTQVRLVKDF